MGMYDHLNRIERAIASNQKQEELKETRATQEQKIKYNLLSLLATTIEDAKSNGFDLYNIDVKDSIIENVMNYEATIYLHGKDFTRYFLNENYYKTLKQINNRQKEAEKPAKDFQKQIEKETKEDLQKQKLRMQIEAMKNKEEEKKRQQQIELQKQLIIKQQEKQGGFIAILKIISYILLAPLLITGFFLVECAKEAGRTGGRRR